LKEKIISELTEERHVGIVYENLKVSKHYKPSETEFLPGVFYRESALFNT